MYDNSVDLNRMYGLKECQEGGGCGQISFDDNTAASSQSATQMPRTFQNSYQSYPQPATMHNDMLMSPQYHNQIEQSDISNYQPTTSATNPTTPYPMATAQKIPFTYEQFPSLNGFIRTQIGRRVRAEFLVGTNTMVAKDGYLVGVGSNYMLINEIGTKTITAGDFYALKFISFPY